MLNRPKLSGSHAYRGDDPGTLSEQNAARCCDIYFIRMEDALQPIKIGKSFATGKRHRILQCGSPYRLTCIGLLYGEGAFESAWHNRFDAQRLLGEWFRPTTELLETIEDAIQRGSRKALGLPEPHDWRAELGLS